MSSPKELIDAHTFSLPSQGSIYTQSTICLTDGTCKLIVASLNRKVFCCELSMTHCALPCGCVIVPQVGNPLSLFSPPKNVFLLLANVSRLVAPLFSIANQC